jgi:hypothetical protein
LDESDDVITGFSNLNPKDYGPDNFVDVDYDIDVNIGDKFYTFVKVSGKIYHGTIPDNYKSVKAKDYPHIFRDRKINNILNDI